MGTETYSFPISWINLSDEELRAAWEDLEKKKREAEERKKRREAKNRVLKKEEKEKKEYKRLKEKFEESVTKE